MREDLLARWSAIEAGFASPFRDLARRIVRHPSDDFELLWLMMTFAELSIRYASMLVLSHGYHNPDSADALFGNLPREDLRRATLGQWVQFLRSSIEGSKPRNLGLPFGGLASLSDPFCKGLDPLVWTRNRLAHDLVLTKFDVTPGKVEEVAAVVLAVIEGLQSTCSPEPVRDGAIVRWPPPPGASSGASLHPFILQAGDNESLRLFDSLKGNHAIFLPGHERAPEPAIAASIKRYLTSELHRASLDWGAITSDELLARSRSATRAWRWHVRMDVLVAERYFGEIPPFAGRPTFAERIHEAIASAPTGLTIHLYGQRGSGKRLFLADLLDRLVDDRHVVATAYRFDGSDSPLANRFNESLGITGDVVQLANSVSKSSSGKKLVLLLPVPLPSVHKEYRTALESLLRLPDTHDSICFLLFADDGAPPRRPVEAKHRYVAMPIPPMELDATSRFLEAVMSKPGHSPLTDWELLPDSALEVIGSPGELVTLCQIYDLQPLAGFEIATYLETKWNALLANRAHSANLPEVLRKIAWAMRRTRRSDVRHDEAFAEATEAEHLALDILQRSGYFVADDVIHFSEFEWLVRSLALTIDTHSPSTGDAQRLVAETAGFPVLGDALAESLRGAPVSALHTVFDAALHHAADLNRARLVQALFTQSGLAHDPTLFLELADRALALPDKEVCSGCGAAAQELSADDRRESDLGRRLYHRCVIAAERHRFAPLHLRFMNEYAQHCMDDPVDQEHAFRDTITAAQQLGDTEVEHAAVNNWASAVLQQIRSGVSPAADDAAQKAHVIAELQRIVKRAGTANERTWLNWVATRQHLAVALLEVFPPDPGEAVAASGDAVDLTTRFGSYAEESLANSHHAMILDEAGRPDEAIAAEKKAVALARLASQALDEAQFRRSLARRLIRAAATATAGRRRRLLADALVECRAAKRALTESGSGGAAAIQAKAVAWRDIAGIFEQLGDRAAARLAAEKAVAFPLGDR